MSKVITQRLEYACFDDATQVVGASNVTTTWPTVTDTYVANNSMSAAGSYGTANVNGTGASNVQTSIGANVTFIAAKTNTTLVNITTPAGVSLTPGGASTQVKWVVGPGQMVTFPGAWNTTGILVAQAIDTSFNLNATAFALQAVWSV